MKKIAGMMLACLAVWGGVCAQSVYPGQFEGKFKVENSVPMAAECFDLSDVRLLPSRFRENMERDSAWMVSIEVNHCSIASARRWESMRGVKEVI